MKCYSCNSQIKEGNFCPKCGFYQSSPNDNDKTERLDLSAFNVKKNSSTREFYGRTLMVSVFLWIAFVFVLFFMGVLGYHLVRNAISKTNYTIFLVNMFLFCFWIALLAIAGERTAFYLHVKNGVKEKFAILHRSTRDRYYIFSDGQVFTCKTKPEYAFKIKNDFCGIFKNDVYQILDVDAIAEATKQTQILNKKHSKELLKYPITKIALIIITVIGLALFITYLDKGLSKKYNQPALLFNVITNENADKALDINILGKSTYVQGIDQDIDGTVFVFRKNQLPQNEPLTTLIDPYFDLTRIGVHKDVITYKYVTKVYRYTVLDEPIEQEPISITVDNIKTQYSLYEEFDFDTVATITFANGKKVDMFLDYQNIEDFSTQNKGEFRARIYFTFNGTSVEYYFNYTVK